MVSAIGSDDSESAPAASGVLAVPGATAWRSARIVFFAGLALSGAACEVLISIPDVTLDTGSTSSGGTGGFVCPAAPCAGDACSPVELANGKDVAGGNGGSSASDISGVTARDGFVHWSIDRMPGGLLVGTGTDGVSTKQPVDTVPRRLSNDGENVYFTSVYGACLGVMPAAGGKVTQLGTCVSTSSDRSPGIALDSARAYWTVAMLDDCGAIPGCCAGQAKSCLLGAAKSGALPTVLIGGRLNISDVVIVGSELFFASQTAPTAGAIERCPAEAKACSPKMFVETTYDHSPVVLATARGYIYWSTPAGIVRRLKAGDPQSTPEDMATEAYVTSMVADEGAVYYTTTDGKVYELSHDDPGNPVEIGKGKAGHVALDCANVYWSDGSALMQKRR